MTLIPSASKDALFRASSRMSFDDSGRSTSTPSRLQMSSTAGANSGVWPAGTTWNASATKRPIERGFMSQPTTRTSRSPFSLRALRRARAPGAPEAVTSSVRGGTRRRLLATMPPVPQVKRVSQRVFGSVTPHVPVAVKRPLKRCSAAPLLALRRPRLAPQGDRTAVGRAGAAAVRLPGREGAEAGALPPRRGLRAAARRRPFHPLPRGRPLLRRSTSTPSCSRPGGTSSCRATASSTSGPC